MKTQVPLTKKITPISVVLEDEIIGQPGSHQYWNPTGHRQSPKSVRTDRAILTANLECSAEWMQCPSEAAMIAIIRSRLIMNTLAERKQIKQPRPV